MGVGGGGQSGRDGGREKKRGMECDGSRDGMVERGKGGLEVCDEGRERERERKRKKGCCGRGEREKEMK